MIMRVAIIYLISVFNISGDIKNNLTILDLINELRVGVPEGWDVSINKFTAYHDDVNIQIWREKQLLIHKQRRNMSLMDESKPIKKHFVVNMFLKNFLKPEEYQEIQSKNKVISEKLKKFSESLSDIPRDGKARAFRKFSPIGYNPEDKEQEARVKEFQEYYDANPIKYIPEDYYYSNMSFIVTDPIEWGVGLSENIDKEYKQVRSLIDKILTKYE